jgi:hypothetical protein
MRWRRAAKLARKRPAESLFGGSRNSESASSSSRAFIETQRPADDRRLAILIELGASVLLAEAGLGDPNWF